MRTWFPRRRFLGVVSLVGAGVALAPALVRGADGGTAEEEGAEVGPTEDLMREHGIIRRTLLVYEACAARLAKGEALPGEVLAQAARLMRRFGEDYHEHLEETQVFPALEKAGRERELCQVLRQQHTAGRKLTEQVLAAATPKGLRTRAQREPVVRALGQMVRMYQPHAAREDTVLFPAFRSLYSERELAEVGERFEAEEHRLLGAAGFEGALKEVTQLEQALGINDLRKFTPT